MDNLQAQYDEAVRDYATQTDEVLKMNAYKRMSNLRKQLGRNGNIYDVIKNADWSPRKEKGKFNLYTELGLIDKED